MEKNDDARYIIHIPEILLPMEYFEPLRRLIRGEPLVVCDGLEPHPVHFTCAKCITISGSTGGSPFAGWPGWQWFEH